MLGVDRFGTHKGADGPLPTSPTVTPRSRPGSGADIVRELRFHRATETDLVHEAVNVDLGAGDSS